MNTPARGPAQDGPGFLAEGIADAFWSVGIIAEIGQREAMLGDPAGTAYAVRRLVALTQHLVATAGDYRELQDAQRRQPARAEKVFTTQETTT